MCKPHAHRLVRMLHCLLEKPLDEGSEHFQPSSLQVATIDVGNPATNVIPGTARAVFNVRFNDKHTPHSLKELLKSRAREAAPAVQVHFAWEPASDSFITQPGPFVDLVADAIADVTEKKPQLSTGGGTSDARFVKDYCPVVDFGLVGRTMHQIDEQVSVADLQQLTAIYRRVLERYFA